MPRNIYPRISQETSTPAEIQAVTGRWSITDTPAIASPVTGAGLVEAQRCQYLPPALPGVSMMMAELDAGEALQMLMEGVTGHLDLAVQAAVILLKLKAVCDMAVAEDCCEVEVEGELRTGDNEDNTEDENMAIQGTGHGEEVTRKFDMVRTVWDLQS